MRIALCLFGQPKDYINGYNNIQNFLSKQNNIEYDTFFHTWLLKENETYDRSPWRNVSNNIISENNICNNLINLYNPKKYIFEYQKKFDSTIFENTLIYNNITSDKKLNNINNILSQTYSRNQVRNIFYDYINEFKVEYDFVILTRFDINQSLLYFNEINLNSLDNKYIYLSSCLYPRKMFPDCFMIIPPKIFIIWFNLNYILLLIKNDHNLNSKIKYYNEVMEINMEEIIFACYLYNWSNFDLIKYF